MKENHYIRCRHAFVSADGRAVSEVKPNELQFRPSVYGVIIEDDHVLLLPQYDGQRWGYDFPGGGIDLGERLFDALKREVKEETGFDVEQRELIHLGDDFFVHPRYQQPFHSLVIFYRCRIVGGELSADGFDDGEKEYADQALWKPLDEVASLTFHNPVDNLAIIKHAHAIQTNSK